MQDGGGGGRNQANHEPAARWGIGGSGGGCIGGGAVSNNGTYTSNYVHTNLLAKQESGNAFGQGENAIGNSAGRRRILWRIVWK